MSLPVKNSKEMFKLAIRWQIVNCTFEALFMMVMRSVLCRTCFLFL